ncbi:hypothetical protein MF625_005055 (plasmid) [Paenibacillus polymyxa]|uniref:hypothetical protein n=1 Tax=Paenibacillus polymyxa TaxID=1406 RepID=UPI0020253B26|nr:hypothetical protein [Paenibacillus polymyxa]URJ38184.1 hypothetical protein MF625_005055 [Paenibacillus polymyxa]
MAAAAVVDLSGVTLPLTPADGLTAASSFMGLFGGWTAIGIGISFASIIIGFIFWLVKKGKSAAGTGK